jgi:glycine/D-amino acid oxidase-like deaminating enzyme
MTLAREGDAAGSFDVVVVGSGIVGAMTVWQLSRRGVSTALVAPAAPARSATEASSGIVRCYESTPRMRELSRRSFDLVWGTGGTTASKWGFEPVGSLILFPEAEVGRCEEAASELAGAGTVCEIITGRRLGRRFPSLDGSDVGAGLWEPHAGVADPQRSVRSALRQAVGNGACVITDRVVELLVDSAGAVAGVATPSTAVAARAVVLAAGCGSLELLPALRRHTRTKRIRSAWFSWNDGPLPAVVHESAGLWARPSSDGRAVLVGRNTQDWDAEPVALEELAAPDVAEIAAGWAATWPSLVAGSYLAGRSATDLFSEEGPILGAWHETPGLVVAVGWSGAGFKTAPAAGEAAASASIELLG